MPTSVIESGLSAPGVIESVALPAVDNDVNAMVHLPQSSDPSQTPSPRGSQASDAESSAAPGESPEKSPCGRGFGSVSKKAPGNKVADPSEVLRGGSGTEHVALVVLLPTRVAHKLCQLHRVHDLITKDCAELVVLDLPFADPHDFHKRAVRGLSEKSYADARSKALGHAGLVHFPGLGVNLALFKYISNHPDCFGKNYSRALAAGAVEPLSLVSGVSLPRLRHGFPNLDVLGALNIQTTHALRQIHAEGVEATAPFNLRVGAWLNVEHRTGVFPFEALHSDDAREALGLPEVASLTVPVLKFNVAQKVWQQSSWTCHVTVAVVTNPHLDVVFEGPDPTPLPASDRAVPTHSLTTSNISADKSVTLSDLAAQLAMREGTEPGEHDSSSSRGQRLTKKEWSTARLNPVFMEALRACSLLPVITDMIGTPEGAEIECSDVLGLSESDCRDFFGHDAGKHVFSNLRKNMDVLKPAARGERKLLRKEEDRPSAPTSTSALFDLSNCATVVDDRSMNAPKKSPFKLRPLAPVFVPASTGAGPDSTPAPQTGGEAQAMAAAADLSSLPPPALIAADPSPQSALSSPLLLSLTSSAVPVKPNSNQNNPTSPAPSPSEPGKTPIPTPAPAASSSPPVGTLIATTTLPFSPGVNPDAKSSEQPTITTTRSRRLRLVELPKGANKNQSRG